jgi:hypothetical protein
LEYNKQIGEFSFKRINEVFGGIRANTQYEFTFHCGDVCNNPGKINTIPGLETAFTDNIIKNIYNKFISEITTGINENALILNADKLFSKAVEEFSEKNTDLISEYSKLEIYDFVDLLTSGKAASIAKKNIAWQGENNGCVIIFYLHGMNLYEDLFYLGRPENFDEGDAVIDFGRDLVESVKIFSPNGKVRRYNLPLKRHVLEKIKTSAKTEYHNKTYFFIVKYEKDELLLRSHLVNKKIFREDINILNPNFTNL